MKIHSVGELGEQLVASWLKSKEYQILHQRWRCRWGEIDLIALEKPSNILAFIEVKTRSHNNWDAEGILSIDLRKQQKIGKTAQMFLAQNPTFADYSCRFDVALVSYQSRSTLPLTENDRDRVQLREYLESAFEM